MFLPSQSRPVQRRSYSSLKKDSSAVRPSEDDIDGMEDSDEDEFEDGENFEFEGDQSDE